MQFNFKQIAVIAFFLINTTLSISVQIKYLVDSNENTCNICL